MTAILTLLITVGCFLSYLGVAHTRFAEKRLSRILWINKKSLWGVLFERLSGAVCLGLVPLGLVLSSSVWQTADLGLNLNIPYSSLTWTFGLAGGSIFFSFVFSRKPKNYKTYPQVREKIWTGKTVSLNIGSWLLYLAAYEFLFRGFLLFTLESAIGLWAALVTMTVLYSMAHLHKGLNEVLGAIPFGVILGFLAFKSGSFWPAFFVHACLAISNDFFALAGHPEMSIQRSDAN